MSLVTDANSGIRCVGLRREFDRKLAVGIDEMVVPASGVVAVVGPNGAGKTTLVNIITGFMRPTAGRWWIHGHELTGRSAAAIAQAGVARTFQEVRFVRDVSVEENVVLARRRQSGEKVMNALFGLGVKSEEFRNRAEAERLLEIVGLSALRKAMAQDLSYGQTKLLTIACLLASEARVMFLDEPVAGVDVAMKGTILGLLKVLKEARRLIVFIEHDVDAVHAAADIVFVMTGGAILTSGPPAAVLARPDVLDAYVRGSGMCNVGGE
jgi:branched-chain amino acid transport system ATP-binding protein